MTVLAAYRLAVDFGTSTTVAMLQWPDGRIRPLLFDGSPLLSSAVLVNPDGHQYTGRDAAHLARSYPEGLEPYPKRSIGESQILLGDREVAVSDLVAGLLRRVADEARNVAGQPGDVVMTHPVGWGATRRAALVEAAQRAGLGRPRLITEPVAAAAYFARFRRPDLPPEAPVLIFDLGAGTCDVSLVRGAPSLQVIGSAGLDGVGGLDVDAALVESLQAAYGSLWDDAAGRRRMWDEVRTAKEMLSRTAGTIVTVPTLETELPLNRAEFDAVARPVLEPAVNLVETLLTRSGIRTDEIAGVFLVGGASQIPLVATMLHQALGAAPIVTEQPQLVVAEGALEVPSEPGPAERSTGNVQVGPDGAWPGAPSLTIPAVPAVPAVPAIPAPAPRSGRRIAVALAAVVALLAVAGAAGYALFDYSRRIDQATPDNPTVLHSAGPLSAHPSSVGPAARYTFDKVGNLCRSVDVTPLKKYFDRDEGEPNADRRPGAGFGTASCIRSLGHNDRTGLGTVLVTLDFTVWVFDTNDRAADAHTESRDNATANEYSPVDAALGDRAFTSRKPHTVGRPITDIDCSLEVLDDNLRWIAKMSAQRIDDGRWSPQQENDICAALVESGRLGYTQLVSTTAAAPGK